MPMETLVNELLRLQPDELQQVLESVIKHLQATGQVELAKEIINRYKPALEELAGR